MVLAVKYWMLLWLVVLKFSKASESLIGGGPVAQHTQGELMPESIEQLDQSFLKPVRMSDDEHIDGDLAVSKRQNPSLDSPRKRLRTNGQEVADEDKHVAIPTIVKRPLPAERQAEIKQNLASYQEDLTAMKTSGEAMRNWFNIIMEREEMLEQYRDGVGIESVSSILRKLKEIQREINTVVQIRFRTWAGLGGIAFEPIKQDVIAQPPQELAKGPTDDTAADVEANLNVRFKPQEPPLIISQNSTPRSSVSEERPVKGQGLIEEAESTKASDFTADAMRDQEESKTELNQHLLNIIYKHVMETSFKDLCSILHSITFRSWTDPNWLKNGEEIRVIKVAFEKSILQGIQFMYRFGLIEQGNFKSFSYSHQTLDLLGNHLVQLFHVVKHWTYNALAFIPDMEFLTEHWKTDHLDEIWKVLGKSQKAHVLRVALTSKVQLYLLFEKGLNSTKVSKLIEQIHHKRFFQRLEIETPGNHVSSDPSSFGTADLKAFGKKLIEIYQNPVPNSDWLVPVKYFKGLEIETLQTEHILIYHILDFINTYHDDYMRSLFERENQSEYDILQKQLKLYKQGLRVHKIIQQWQTFNEIILFPNEEICTVSNEQAIREKGRSQEMYEEISMSYHKLEKDFKEITKMNSRAKSWFQGDYTTSKVMLDGFRSRAHRIDVGIHKENARRNWLRILHEMKSKYDDLPNLEIDNSAPLSKRKSFKPPQKELLDLLDPYGFYL